jgi:hypothetical protein
VRIFSSLLPPGEGVAEMNDHMEITSLGDFQGSRAVSLGAQDQLKKGKSSAHERGLFLASN